MRDAQTDATRGTDATDEPLSPALQNAVAALRVLPPTSPDAVARVVAAAERRAATSTGAYGRVFATRGARVRVGGAITVIAAVLAFILVDHPHTPTTLADAPVPTAVVRALPPTPGAPVRAARADADVGDAPRLITFHLIRPGATAVAVVGDFNQWNARATPLARAADGGWAVAVALTPGRHAYRFVVDDSLRVLDPRAPAERDAELGVEHSVVVVGVP